MPQPNCSSRAGSTGRNTGDGGRDARAETVCETRPSQRGLRFVVAIVAVGVLWLVLLPNLGEVPTIRAQIEANEAQGINPGAMYYTELEAMPRIIDEVDRKREAASEAFWKPSFRSPE